MAASEYLYALEQCDVPLVRRGALQQFRSFRQRCLQYLSGEADTSVMNQVYALAWNTAVFRTLNEGRRLEPHRQINGAMWDLIAAGYANLMTLGVRRLVDKDPRTDSVWNVIAEVEKRPELLRRENFVCYDGLPYDYAAVSRKRRRSPVDPSVRAEWLLTKGPEAWSTSELLHESFDALAGFPTRRKRLDTVQVTLLRHLKDRLDHRTIQDVCTFADKTVAHAERISDPPPSVTFNTIDAALVNIVQVASFLSTHFFCDTAFGSIVPVPQYDVLENLDQPWVTTQQIPALHEHWNAISRSMNEWTQDADVDFLPRHPNREEAE